MRIVKTTAWLTGFTIFINIQVNVVRPEDKKQLCDSPASEGGNIKGRDCESNSGNAQTRSEMCPFYNNGTCSKYLKNRRVYLTVDGQRRMEENVTEMFSQFYLVLGWARDMKLDILEYLARKSFSEDQKEALRRIKSNRTRAVMCYEKSVQYYCYKHFSVCGIYAEGSRYYFKKEKLCREACADIRLICADELKFLPFFGSPEVQSFFELNCESLPEFNSSSTGKCIYPGVNDKDHTTTVAPASTQPSPHTKQTFSKSSKGHTVVTTTDSLRTVTTTTTPETTAVTTTQARSSSTTDSPKTSHQSDGPATTTRATPKSIPQTKGETSPKTKRRIKTRTIPKTDPQTKEWPTTSSTGSHNETATTTYDKKTGEDHQKREQINSDDVTWFHSHEKVVIYSSCAAGLFIILVIAVLFYFKRRSRSSSTESFADDIISPYDVQAIDNTTIRRLMQSKPSESDDETAMPPPLPPISERGSADHIRLLVYH